MAESDSHASKYGIAHSFQIVDDLPSELHDIFMDAVIDPSLDHPQIGRTDCVRVSRRGTPVVQITIIRDDPPKRPKLGIAKGKFRLPTWEEDKAMDREIEGMFTETAK